MNGVEDAPLGLLSFLSFAFSIIAAVLAIDMYKLLRTGEFGKTWRLLIIASVMLALLQVLRMAEVLNFRPVTEAHLSQIVELCFIMSLAYAFYIQRKLFTHEPRRGETEDEEILSAEDEPEDGLFEEHAIFEEYDGNDHDSQPLTNPKSDAAPDSVSKPQASWAQYESADISRPAP